jgi:hypothetical protein
VALTALSSGKILVKVDALEPAKPVDIDMDWLA